MQDRRKLYNMKMIVRWVAKDPLLHTLYIWFPVSVLALFWAVPFASDSSFLRVIIILKLWTLWSAGFMVYCMRWGKRNNVK